MNVNINKKLKTDSINNITNDTKNLNEVVNDIDVLPCNNAFGINVDTYDSDTTSFNSNKNKRLSRKINKKNKLDLLIFNNGWNDNNENLVVSIGENAASYKWMHNKCGKRYNNYSKILGLLIIILNSGLSFQNIFNFNNRELYCSQNDPLIITQKITIWIVTLLSIIYNFLNFEKRSGKHFYAANSFSELYHDIQKQMCLYRKDRNNAVKYISTVMKKYDSLELSGPELPGWITKKYKRKFKDEKFLDNIQKIDIIEEENNETKSSNEKNDNVIINMNLSNESENTKNSNYSNFIPNGMSNLSAMNNCFKIDGDLSENDDVQSFSKKYHNAKALYEMMRFENL